MKRAMLVILGAVIAGYLALHYKTTIPTTLYGIGVIIISIRQVNRSQS